MDAALQVSYLVQQVRPLLAELNDSHLFVEPIPGLKTAGWLVGHLAVTGDFARRWCGRTAHCPPEWDRSFSPGSSPALERTAYPPMADLIDRLLSVYDDLPLAWENASAASLSLPNPYVPARPAFPTVNDFVTYLATSHLGYHIAELKAWHRTMSADR